MIRLTQEHPHSDVAQVLIKELNHDIFSRYPDQSDEDTDTYSEHNLLDPDTLFFVAWQDDESVGCGALRALDDGSAMEVKRMYVRADFRRRGIAGQILGKLEETAVSLNHTHTRLETGSQQGEAIQLYEKLGYQRIPCYGVYADMPESICFEKQVRKPMRVIKVGGNELNDPAFVSGLAQAVGKLKETEQVVLVHGGGKAIVELLDKLAIPTRKIDGLRVTDSDTLGVAEMVLSGQANKLLVRGFLNEGVGAIGISGVDGGLIRVVKLENASGDLGFVGKVTQVNTHVLHALLTNGYTPLISPISLGEDGQAYNVNADDAATAIGAALNADMLDFVSNVPGVLKDGERIDNLTELRTEQLIETAVITDGMIPKVRGAIGALNAGVKQVRITNLQGILDGGTVFKRDEG